MKIVLIEGNSVERHAIRSMLEERKEKVVAFANGLDAWSYINDHDDIDIIITALNAQGMTGLEICWNSRILADERKGMYVIAISQANDADMLVEALDSGADDYLQKPLHEETLLARLRVAERMILLQKQLVHLANRDPMTNLYNRRAFFELSVNMLAEASQDNPVCAIMFDIDHFKKVNDTHGHDAGDEVIKTVAALAASEDGLLGRLGGEEFALIVKGQSLLTAARTANRLREDIENTPADFEDQKIFVTSSFGVAVYRDGDTVDDMLKRADLALYKSKHDGRNRVSAESPRLIAPGKIDPSQMNIRLKSRA